MDISSDSSSSDSDELITISLSSDDDSDSKSYSKSMKLRRKRKFHYFSWDSGDDTDKNQSEKQIPLEKKEKEIMVLERRRSSIRRSSIKTGKAHSTLIQDCDSHGSVHFSDISKISEEGHTQRLTRRSLSRTPKKTRQSQLNSAAASTSQKLPEIINKTRRSSQSSYALTPQKISENTTKTLTDFATHKRVAEHKINTRRKSQLSYEKTPEKQPQSSKRLSNNSKIISDKLNKKELKAVEVLNQSLNSDQSTFSLKRQKPIKNTSVFDVQSDPNVNETPKRIKVQYEKRNQLNHNNTEENHIESNPVVILNRSASIENLIENTLEISNNSLKNNSLKPSTIVTKIYPKSPINSNKNEQILEKDRKVSFEKYDQSVNKHSVRLQSSSNSYEKSLKHQSTNKSTREDNSKADSTEKLTRKFVSSDSSEPENEEIENRKSLSPESIVRRFAKTGLPPYQEDSDSDKKEKKNKKTSRSTNKSIREDNINADSIEKFTRKFASSDSKIHSEPENEEIESRKSLSPESIVRKFAKKGLPPYQVDSDSDREEKKNKKTSRSRTSR
ncbi:dentin sialophosphoprotein-like [Chrysoperla carnea]|uniref:dentin sialophosphoprotein-like n=1 Tax=Chrysoperla carnea TaxID=189513 RepID=UPI001D096984|nr:dentin sialophosphoprotein-like [Chrysoperla carnea]